MNKDLNRTELYDIENDWAEKKDMAAEYPDVVKELSEKVDTWKAGLPTEPKEHCTSKTRK